MWKLLLLPLIVTNVYAVHVVEDHFNEGIAKDVFLLIPPEKELPTKIVTGTRKVLGIRVNFADAPPVCTEGNAVEYLFDPESETSVKKYYQTVSRGRVEIKGDVVTVSIASTIKDAKDCEYQTWATLADEAAVANGVSLSGYHHKMYFLPENVPCTWGGLGTVSGKNTWLKTCSAQTMTHELGHNFGMAHASTLTSEYGDGSDPMGVTFRELNSPHRHQLGWMPSGKVKTISETGTYKVSPLSNSTALDGVPQIIRIHRPVTDEYVYLSYRVPEGGFDFSMGEDYSQKLNIHRYKGEGAEKTFFIAGLDVGEVHKLTEGDFTITVISKDDNSMEFSVSSE